MNEKTEQPKTANDETGAAVGVDAEVMPFCKTCKHWNNKQSELEYNKRMGICTCYKWRFTTTNYSDVVLLDRGNRSQKFMGVQRFESQLNEIPFGRVEPSQYCLITEETFGCIHHKKA